MGMGIALCICFTNAKLAIKAEDVLLPPSEREGDHEVVEGACVTLSLD